MKTAVVFRKFKGEIIALFPEHVGTNNPQTCLAYAHNGQHFSIDSTLRCAKASPEEYSSLAKELAFIGYDLRIISKASPAHFACRLKALGIVRT